MKRSILLLLFSLPLCCFAQSASSKNYGKYLMEQRWHFFVKKEEHATRRINACDIPYIVFTARDSIYRKSGGASGKWYVAHGTLCLLAPGGAKQEYQILSCDRNFLWIKDNSGNELWAISLPIKEEDRR